MYFANDPRHFAPETGAFTIKSFATTGCADVLAGEAASHDINTASPRSAVKGSHVIPNRERGESAVVLARDEDGLGVGLVLDGTNTSASK
ncbi:hypothetical protein AX767_01545 [Variovorax sp. PAMC 28711]|nr:hypothetical protein AX767_01545 [Variovorax sp. PAMC 28711]